MEINDEWMNDNDDDGDELNGLRWNDLICLFVVVVVVVVVTCR